MSVTLSSRIDGDRHEINGAIAPLLRNKPDLGLLEAFHMGNGSNTGLSRRNAESGHICCVFVSE
jgi:hypothetical protein